MRRKLSFTVPKDCDGFTVKMFVRRYLKLSARVLIKQKMAEGGMEKNGERCRSIDFLRAGDVFTMQIPSEEMQYALLETPIDVLYEDEDYLIVNKPCGMPVHPSGTHDGDSLLNAVAFHYKNSGNQHLFRPLYRLDRDTSGIVAIAKHRIAASTFSVKKTYYAVCEGKLIGNGVVKAPIDRMENTIIKRTVTESGKPAVTRWEAIETDGIHTLLKFDLKTGRTHQIRVHMSHIGHPLAGDDLYGGSCEYIKRQALHCGDLLLKSAPLDFNRFFASEFPADIKKAFSRIVLKMNEQ